MANTQLRQLYGQEMHDVMFPLGMYAFRPSPPFMNREEWDLYARERQGVTYLAMFEEGLPAAGAAGSPMHANLRGKIYPSSGVWGVAAHPAYRRKGYVRQAMTALLAAQRAEGLVLSALYPFRESFYERLGYVALPKTIKTQFASSGTAPLLKKDLGGQVTLKPLSEVYTQVRDFLFKLQPDIHGMAIFDYPTPGNAVRRPAWVALATIAGELEGVMIYSLKGEEVAQFMLHAPRFYYRSSLARTLLLEWIARHIDQATQVEINLPPYERPELWLSDLKVLTTTREIGPMGRVLDIAGLGGLPVGPGSFTVQVSDPVCPWNDACWRFASDGGQLTVTSAAQADCTLSIQAISALAYGTLDPQDFSLRGWGSPTPALQATLRAMFPRLIPHLHEEF